MQVRSKFILYCGIFIGIWIFLYNLELNLVKLFFNPDLDISIIFNDIVLIFHPLVIFFLGTSTITLSLTIFTLLLNEKQVKSSKYKLVAMFTYKIITSLSREELIKLTLYLSIMCFLVLILGGNRPHQVAFTKFIAEMMVVAVSIIIHELSHLSAANYFGTSGKFNLSMIGFIFVFIAFIFGLPLFTMGIITRIGKNASSSENTEILRSKKGYISTIGPISNLILVGIFYIILAIGFSLPGQALSNLLIYLGYVGVSYNVFIGLSQLIPIGELDGTRILSWEAVIWVALFVVFIFLGSVGGGFGLFFSINLLI